MCREFFVDYDPPHRAHQKTGYGTWLGPMHRRLTSKQVLKIAPLSNSRPRYGWMPWSPQTLVHVISLHPLESKESVINKRRWVLSPTQKKTFRVWSPKKQKKRFMSQTTNQLSSQRKLLDDLIMYYWKYHQLKPSILHSLRKPQTNKIIPGTHRISVARTPFQYYRQPLAWRPWVGHRSKNVNVFRGTILTRVFFLRFVTFIVTESIFPPIKFCFWYGA